MTNKRDRRSNIRWLARISSSCDNVYKEGNGCGVECIQQPDWMEVLDEGHDTGDLVLTEMR